jgi:hypothetical protein
LWLLPFGLLVYRSGFIPKIIGVLLWVAGVGYLLECVVSLLAPANSTFDTVFRVLEIGELPIVFWLLIMGAKDQPSGGRAAAQAA